MSSSTRSTSAPPMEAPHSKVRARLRRPSSTTAAPGPATACRWRCSRHRCWPAVAGYTAPPRERVMTQGANREVLPDGSVRITSGESALKFARPTSSVLVVTITGYDKGQFGTAPFDEIDSVLRVAAPLRLFVDARNAVGATVRVSEDWT